MIPQPVLIVISASIAVALAGCMVVLVALMVADRFDRWFNS